MAPRSRRPTARVSSARLTVMSAAPAVAPKAVSAIPRSDREPGHRPAFSGGDRRLDPLAVNRDPFDPAADDVLDHQTESFDVDRLTHAGHPAELRQHQTADRAHVVAVEAVTQRGLQLGQGHAALDPPLVLAHTWIGATSSVSYSSWISPTICSRMSSSVTMPAVPPNSSTTTAR